MHVNNCRLIDSDMADGLISIPDYLVEAVSFSDHADESFEKGNVCLLPKDVFFFPTYKTFTSHSFPYKSCTNQKRNP